MMGNAIVVDLVRQMERQFSKFLRQNKSGLSIALSNEAM